MHSRFIATLLFLLGTAFSASAAESPEYMASFMPVHSLVAGVMGDEGRVGLIVPGHASPHNFVLKPSQMKHIQDAKLVFILNRHFERFLEKTLENDSRVIELSKAPGVKMLDNRSRFTLDEAYEAEEHKQGLAGEEEHEHEQEHHHEHNPTLPDYHLWLNPANAIALTNFIAQALSSHDPAHAELYTRNAKAQVERINAMKGDIEQMLAGAKYKPDGKAIAYLTYHDAYQYFERAFGLDASEFLVNNPENNAGAGHIEEIEKQLEKTKLACIFSEPQFNAKITQRIADRYHAELRLLNPDGSLLTPGKDVYFDVMQSVAKNITECMLKARELAKPKES